MRIDYKSVFDTDSIEALKEPLKRIIDEDLEHIESIELVKKSNRYKLILKMWTER